MLFRSLLLSGSAILLVGCGSGGGDIPPHNPPAGEDVTPPSIYLTGASSTEVLKDGVYTELGARAEDDVDGTVQVKIEGSVDTSVLGETKIKYTAVDSSGNIAETYRDVDVVTVFTVKTKIKVLAIYNSESKAMYPEIETRLNHFINFTNTINDNSNIDLTVELAHTEEIGMDQTLSSDIILGNIQNNKGIQDLRDQYNADEVLIYRPYANDEMCGIAYINTPLIIDYAFAHISIDCYSEATPHELGHNYGLNHSHKQGGEGIFPYSFGHGVQDDFVTIMAYQSAFNVNDTIPIYSNPNKNDCNGQPCGIEEGYAGEADASRTIREVMNTVSSYNN